MKTQMEMLRLSKLRVGENHRSDETEDLSGMMESIKNVGLLEPIGVAKDESGGGYRVIYGFRRYWAVKKLGLDQVACVVHADLDSVTERTINLAENVQRRAPSLTEVGRYADTMMSENKLSIKELAVKLGVETKYIDASLKHYRSIPEEYRESVEKRAPGRRDLETQNDGMISVQIATAIRSASKLLRLSKPEIEKLFAAAKEHGYKFQRAQVNNYALNIRNGKDIFEGLERLRAMPSSGMYTQTEYDRIYNKYIMEPTHPYRTIAAVVRAIIKGELAEKMDVI